MATQPVFKTLVPSDTEDFPFVYNSLRVGGRGGVVRLLVPGVGERTLRVVAGVTYHVAFRRLFQTGTTASGFFVSLLPPGTQILPPVTALDWLTAEDGEHLLTEAGDEILYE